MAEHEGEAKRETMSNRKIIIIIVVALLINVALVAGVLMFTLDRQGGAKAAEASVPKGTAKKEAPFIYPLEPFVVNIHDGTDLRYMKLKVELETTHGPDDKSVLDPYLPQLRDAILLLLTTKSLQDISDLDGKNRLRKEILTAVDRILPPGRVSQVLFTDFMVQ